MGGGGFRLRSGVWYKVRDEGEIKIVQKRFDDGVWCRFVHKYSSHYFVSGEYPEQLRKPKPLFTRALSLSFLRHKLQG